MRLNAGENEGRARGHSHYSRRVVAGANLIETQVRERVHHANASRAQFLGLAFGVTYLVGGLGDVLAMGTLRNHGFMALQCLSSFVMVPIVRWVVPPSAAAVIFSSSIVLSAALGGAHVAQFGGFDGPWFYGCYTAPPIFIAMLLKLPHRLAATLATSAAFTLTYWLRRPDLFDYPMAHVPLVYLLTISGIAAGLGQWVYRLEVQSFTDLARVEAAASRLEERLHSGGGELRASLARQLHDDVAQLITGARFQLDTVSRRGAKDDQVDRLSSLLDELSQRAHVMLDQLRAPAAHGPLKDELLLVQRDFKGLGLAVDLLLDEGWVAQAPAADSHVVLSVAREALTNAVRHARASEATVSVQAHGDEVSLLIVDNGGGRSTTLREGHGVRGMRERAQQLGGALELGEAETGLRVAVTWPRRERA